MKDWLRRRWTDIRNGYSFYLGLGVGFVNFILLIRLNFPSLLDFAPLIGLGLLLIAGTIGYLHRRIQWGTDNNSAFENAPLQAKIQRILLKTILREADPQEVLWALKTLKTIEDGTR